MFTADQKIGPYTLIRRIGRGGFGEVWLAERRSQFFSKKLAIKLPHDDQVDLKTIGMEAALWEQASGHPNVLPIIDADVYDGQIVIASEYADGGSLADRVKHHGRPTNEQSIKLVIGVLNGLEFLHERKIIHRDVKPQNILIQGDTPRLADFGISRAMQTTANSSIVAGTDAYMSPESFEGKRSPQTDIWSVGVLLFELVSGSLPFPQEHPSERMYAILTREPLDLDSIQPSMLRAVIGKALEKEPSKRYATAWKMREHLEWVLKDAELNSTGDEKTVVLDSHLSQLTIETPRSHISPEPATPTPLLLENPREFEPERVKQTQLVVPLLSKPEPDRPSFLESYSDEPIEDDEAGNESRKLWVYYAVVGGVLLLFLLLYALISSGSSDNAGKNASPSPKPTSSPTPSVSPTKATVATASPNPLTDLNPASSTKNGRYVNDDGYLDVRGSSIGGFSFNFKNGLAPKGSGGECSVIGEAEWSGENRAFFHHDSKTSGTRLPGSPCRIEFTFVGSSVTVQGPNCSSFCGPGVSVGGTYTKK